MKKVILLLFLLNSVLNYSQTKNEERLIAFNKKFYTLINDEKYDSITNLLYKIEAFPNLTKIEKQSFHFIKAIYYNRIQNFDLAIKSFNTSLEYKNNESKYAKRFFMYAYSGLADAYFTKEEYKNAYKNALLAKPFFTAEDYHEYVLNYTVIGYYYYTKKDFSGAEKNYLIAKKAIILNKDNCKLPEIEMKLAQIYDAQGNFNLALKTINNCIKVSTLCQSKENEINARESKTRILKNNNQLKTIIAEKDSIALLQKNLDLQSRNQKIDSLETQLKTQLKEEQNKNLIQVNTSNKNQLNTQKWILFGTISGLIVLLILLFSLYKLSKKQKKLNATLQNQKTEIEKNNANLERLNLLNQKIFSVISHDFKAPMLNLEMLLRKNETQTNLENFKSVKEKIANNVSQANQIMENLMSWSKRELGFSNQIEQITNVHTLVNDVILQLENVIAPKKITTINEIQVDKTIVIPADIVMIIFRNLINNAIKFSYEENDIIISFNEITNEFSVQDFGVGMKTNQVNTLFIQKTESKLGTHNETGFGIGLQFVNELIAQNNGKIRIESILHEGTTVFFSFF